MLIRPLATLRQLFRPLPRSLPAPPAAAPLEVPYERATEGRPAPPANAMRQSDVVPLAPLEPAPGDQRLGSQLPEEGPTQLARLMAGCFGARTEEALAPLFDTLARAMVEEVSGVVRGVRDSLADDLAGLRESAATTQRECSRMGREVMRAGGTVDGMVANIAQLAAMLQRLETDLGGERDNARHLAAEIREAVWSETLGDILATLDGLEAALEEGRAIGSALANVARQIDDPTVRRWWRAMGEASGIKRALPSIPTSDVESWLKGLELTHRRLRDALMRRGVMVVDAIGQPFDPHWHEAVAVEPCSGEQDGIVLRVELNGYRRGDKVVRLAHVVVGKPQPPVGQVRRRRKETSSDLDTVDEGDRGGIKETLGEIGAGADGDAVAVDGEELS